MRFFVRDGTPEYVCNIGTSFLFFSFRNNKTSLIGQLLYIEKERRLGAKTGKFEREIKRNNEKVEASLFEGTNWLIKNRYRFN